MTISGSAATRLALAAALTLCADHAAAQPAPGPAPVAVLGSGPDCAVWRSPVLRRDPTERELRCRYGVQGPGRFGLSVYMEVPVYQPATPLPGTHVVAVPGLPRPRRGESYEEWEWRVLRTEFGRDVRHVFRQVELLNPAFAERIGRMERQLADFGIPFFRRETWRSPERQAFLFQQGRSRPGPLTTATLTSWHSFVDARGEPAGKAADYTVAHHHLQRFHEIAWANELETYGPDSNDPGHVYLPDLAPFPADELVLLRLLPRVPVVTLATGRPTDEPVTAAQRADLRAASFAFAWEPFFPNPAVRLASERPPITVIADSAEVDAAPIAPVQRPRAPLAALAAWLANRFR